MPDKVRPASLSLALPKSQSPVSSNVTSPTDAGSNPPSPRQMQTRSAETLPISESHTKEDEPNSPDFTSLPPFPSSPKTAPKHSREQSKGFFSNLKASKSSNKVYQIEPTIRHVSEDNPRSKSEGNEKIFYSIRKSPDSTPDLSLSTLQDTPSEDREGKSSTPNQLALYKLILSKTHNSQ